MTIDVLLLIVREVVSCDYTACPAGPSDIMTGSPDLPLRA
jgi:hypothetical protein